MNKEQKIRKALLKDFKELLQPEFTIDWKIEQFKIEMYLRVMNLDNLIKIIDKLKGE